MSVVGEEIVSRNFTCCLKSNCPSVRLQKEDLSARSNDLLLAVVCGRGLLISLNGYSLSDRPPFMCSTHISKFLYRESEVKCTILHLYVKISITCVTSSNAWMAVTPLYMQLSISFSLFALKQ